MSTGRKALWQQKHPCCGQIPFESVSKAVNKNTIEKNDTLEQEVLQANFIEVTKAL